ncbi:helix-turn-helix domain-containing protein [Thiorhodovibrio frisius]|uniref:Helix-turn-helix domain-containing protein n=1 Tax=Thiorhodovibrio frisius TaxID=631362 RepID=H8Z719_9GAMM|nr:helix-turn-helix domain-containing protein [Thiorhodovibrio frisius]EIC20818.1 hypothetical protein Thi970DRAFT_04482 [Thiorhodovibrio frisius]WPL21870.1 Helix-turn-helix domain protein [Thiorhodovibrio frisius]
MALEGEYLEEDSAAAYLGVTRRTLQRWWSERIGPPRTYIGRKPWYRRAALQKWLLDNERTPAREAA